MPVRSIDVEDEAHDAARQLAPHRSTWCSLWLRNRRLIGEMPRTGSHCWMNPVEIDFIAPKWLHTSYQMGFSAVMAVSVGSRGTANAMLEMLAETCVDGVVVVGLAARLVSQYGTDRVLALYPVRWRGSPRA